MVLLASVTLMIGRPSLISCCSTGGCGAVRWVATRSHGKPLAEYG